MMEPRKKHSQKATDLPKDFIKAVANLFNKQFLKERDDAEFWVYGKLYMNEVLVCVSLSHQKSLRACSFYLSMDLDPAVSAQPEQVTDKIKSMVDVAASWFSQSFSEAKGKQKGLDVILDAMAEMEAEWQATKWDNQDLFVKLNRDNHGLEGAANKFLRDAGIDPDEDEFEEELAELEEIEEESRQMHSPKGPKKIH
jgi:hypothetical protein